jgi:hypothetical protein
MIGGERKNEEKKQPSGKPGRLFSFPDREFFRT